MKTYKLMKQLVAVCVLLFKCGRVMNADTLIRSSAGETKDSDLYSVAVLLSMLHLALTQCLTNAHKHTHIQTHTHTHKISFHSGARPMCRVEIRFPITALFGGPKAK